MKKYQLTEDMAQVRKYWMTEIMAGPAQGDGKTGEKKGENHDALPVQGTVCGLPSSCPAVNCGVSVSPSVAVT